MACLTIISTNSKMACGAPPTGHLASLKGMAIINASDISSFSVSETGVVISMAAGRRGYALETGNNSTVVSLSLKGGEVFPPQHDVTIETTLFGRSIENIYTGRVWTGGANGRYIFIADHGNNVYKVYGLGAPLEVLSVEGSSTGNGFVRTTFGVEDWQAGTTIYNLTKAQYEALQVPAPTGGGGRPRRMNPIHHLPKKNAMGLASYQMGRSVPAA